MEELYRTIEKKIKDAGYPTDPMFYFPNLRMILSLNIILLLWMKSLISVY